MDTAIGNYVHYHKSNYDKYGINLTGTTPSNKWSDAYRDFKRQLLDINEMNTLAAESKDLEDQYNAFFYPKDKTNKQVKMFREQMERVIQERLNEEFELRAGRFDIRTFTVKETELAKQLNEAIKKTQEDIGKIEMKYVKNCQQLLEKTQLLYKILESNEFKSIKPAKQKIKQAKKQLTEISNNLTQLINEADGKKVKLNKAPEDVQTMRELIAEFNRVARVSNQNGQIFEWILPFIQYQAATLGKQELKAALEDLTRNNSTQLGQVNIKLEMPDLEEKGLTDIDIIKNNIKVKTVSTRSKTDVIITYEDSSNELNTKAVSAKNLSINEVHLVNDTSLYRVLLLSNANKFATHYLNVVSTAPMQQSNQERIVEANRLIKGLILKLSAEGFDESGASELLIVNDQTNKRIKVYNIKVLIHLIQNQLIENGKYTDLVEIPDTFTLPQRFDKDSKDRRILNLIRSTQQHKLNTTLKSDALDDYYKLLNY